MSAASKASKVISRMLESGRCAGRADIVTRTVLPITNSVAISAAVPPTVAIAVRRVIFSPRKSSRLPTSCLRTLGMQIAITKKTKCNTSKADVNRTPRFDHLIRVVKANLESTNSTKTTATLVDHAATRTREDLKYQRKGATAAVQALPKAMPASAVKITRTTTSKKTSEGLR